MSSDPLSETLVALSRYFIGDSTLRESLLHVSELAVRAVPAAAFAGITMIVEGETRTGVFTDPTSPEIDQAQYDQDSGPCLDAFRTGETFVIDDTSSDTRWPAFAAAAHAAGVASTLSLPLRVEHSALGALNLYSRDVAAFPADVASSAGDFAIPAAAVLANAQAFWDAQQLSAGLTEAMAFRAGIEQAKGILMATQRCGPDDAFELLVKASQRENVKLRVIAQRIVDTHALD